MDSNYLIKFFEEHCNIEVSERTLNIFKKQLQRLGHENKDDFISHIVIECLETKNKITTLDDSELYRIIDRVAHRLLREFKKLRNNQVHIDNIFLYSQDNSANFPSTLMSIIEIISKLSVFHINLFEKKVIEGKSIREIAQEENISERTLYRRLEEIKNALRKLFPNVH